MSALWFFAKQLWDGNHAHYQAPIALRSIKLSVPAGTSRQLLSRGRIHRSKVCSWFRVSIHHYRLKHANDPNDASCYPIRLYQERNSRPHCRLCPVSSEKVVLYDELGETALSYYCASCFEEFHATSDGSGMPEHVYDVVEVAPMIVSERMLQ